MTPIKPAAEAKPAVAGEEIEVDLTDEEVEALREMVAMFRSVKGMFEAVARLMGGKV